MIRQHFIRVLFEPSAKKSNLSMSSFGEAVPGSMHPLLWISAAASAVGWIVMGKVPMSISQTSWVVASPPK